MRTNRRAGAPLPSLPAEEEVSTRSPIWRQAALDRIPSCILLLHPAPCPTSRPTTASHPTLHPTSQLGWNQELPHPGVLHSPRRGQRGPSEGFAYFVSSSLSFSVSCLSSSLSPSFSFSFSFSSFSSWLLRGICCCCCKTRHIKQNKLSAGPDTRQHLGQPKQPRPNYTGEAVARRKTRGGVPVCSRAESITGALRGCGIGRGHAMLRLPWKAVQQPCCALWGGLRKAQGLSTWWHQGGMRWLWCSWILFPQLQKGGC